MKHREGQPPFPLKLEKELVEPSSKKKINPSIYEASFTDKEAWLEKKVLAKLGKKS